jgi:hypothetical protein
LNSAWRHPIVSAGRWGSILLMAAALHAPVHAQVDSLAVATPACPGIEPVEEVHPLQEALAMFLLPKVLQDGFLLKEYVVSDEFRDVRRRCGDVAAVDVLFRRALRMSWNNPYATLVIVTLAVLDHHRFGVRIPFLGPLLWFPLTSEFPEEFARRHVALPLRLYPDSPAWGDRDKLQHFFGSALVAVLTGSHATVDRVGTFIEWGEDRFIVEGTLEGRDLEANSRGGSFGLAFLRDRAVLPSVYMQTALSVPSIDTVQVHEEE